MIHDLDPEELFSFYYDMSTQKKVSRYQDIIDRYGLDFMQVREKDFPLPRYVIARKLTKLRYRP